MRCLGSCVLVVTTVLFGPLPLAAAQQNLAELQRTFGSEWKQLGGGSESNGQQRQELLQRHASVLAQFLTDQAKGDDRWNGRLMLADLRMVLADQAGAKAALQAIDAQQAPGLVLLTAADMAGRIGLPELRSKWIDTALQKDGKLEERMAMARVLMTLLREVKRGDAVIEQALAAAKDDNSRAVVLWHKADCIREREDLPENAYFDALEQLARELPDSYYGGIARDRCAASKFQLGGAPVLFQAKTTAGETIELAKLRGKTVVLCFWAATEPSAPAVLAAVKELRTAPAGDDLFVLGIAVDPDLAAFTQASKDGKVDFPQVCDGRGWQSDLALRYLIETVPTFIVIGKDGKLAGLNLHCGNAQAQQELLDAVVRARKGQ